MFDSQYKEIVLVTLAVLAIGTVGYMAIEGWNFEDAFYMTIITVTTTGYGETHELSSPGRYFTVFLLIIGVGAVAYAASQVMGAMISMNFQGRARKKMESRLNELSGHTIVLGFGRMGKAICRELKKSGEEFCVVEQATNLIEDLKKEKFIWVEGDAANDENLKKAGIERARCLVSVVDNDADGLFAALAGRTLNEKIHIVVRANKESSKKKILLAGADKVVLPYVLSAKKVAQSIIHPDFEDFLELSSTGGKEANSFGLVEFDVNSGSALEGSTLRTCGLKRDGIIVVGVRKPDLSFVFAPDADAHFVEGDCIVALGTNESIIETREQLNLS